MPHIGPYEVQGEIGRGGMGAVFKARAPDGRSVAVKVLLSAGSARAIERFERERRLLAELDETEGFVPLLDAGSSPRGPFIVMPFVEGGTLRSRLRGGPMKLDETKALAIALARALGRAHARGIVHRDLKPDNVLFTADGRPLVADLGLAKHFLDEGEGGTGGSLSRTGVMSGTAGYMAPEQMRDAKNVGPGADVFAIGAMLYECVTGYRTFAGETAQETFALALAGRFEPVRTQRADCPPWLASVIERCLAFEPRARYADGSALAAALEAEAVARGPRRAGAVLGATALAAGLVAAIGTGVALGTRMREGSPPLPPSPLRGEGAARPLRAEWEGPHPPKAEGGFAAPCRGFLRTRGTRLAEVFGQYEWKHADQTDCVAISPDGRLALSGARDETVRLWEVATGREIWCGPGHTNGVWAVAFSHDGKHAVSGGWDHEIRYWDVATGKEAKRFRGHTDQISGLAFSPDGKQLLSASADSTVKLWDVASAALVRMLGGPTAAVAFHPDGKRAVSSGDSTLVLWDFATGKELRRFPGHTAVVGSVAISPDGKRILSSSWDRTIKLWDLERGDVLATIVGHTECVRQCAFSPDGKRAISASFDGTVRTWDLEKAEKGQPPALALLRGHPSWVLGVAFSPDGTRAISAGWYSMLRVWDLATGKQVNPIEGHEGPVSSLVLAPEGTRLISGSLDATIAVRDLTTGKVTATLKSPNVVTCVAAAPDGRHVLAANPDGLEYYEIGSGRAIHRLVGHTPWVVAAAISPDGKRAISGGSDHHLRTWDLESGKALSSLDGEVIRQLRYYPDGERALSVGEDSRIFIWELTGVDADRNVSFEAHPKTQVASLDFSVDGRRALTGGDDGTLKLWDMQVSTALRALPGHRGAVLSVAQSPDGRVGVSAGADGTIRVWDLDTGIERDRIDLASSADHAKTIAFARDGRSFYAGTGRGVVLHFELGKK